MKYFIKILVFAVVLLISSAAFAESELGKDYELLSPAQPTRTKNIEVLEFFSYDCIHCFRLHPLLAVWEKSLPPDVALTRIPVVFRPSNEILARIFYTLSSLGEAKRLDDAIFRAIHIDKVPLERTEQVSDFLVKQGVDRTKFIDTFNSFGTQTKVRQARQMGEGYRLKGTPTLAVEGKYAINGLPPEDAMRVLNDLIAKARKERSSSPGESKSAQAKHAEVSVKDPWVRAAGTEQKATGAFMQLRSSTDVRLIEARSPVAAVVEIHEMLMENNALKMRAVAKGLELPAGKTVELKPGSYHIMLIDLRQPIKIGDTVALTLVVEDKDKNREVVEVKAPVWLTGTRSLTGSVQAEVVGDKEKQRESVEVKTSARPLTGSQSPGRSVKTDSGLIYTSLKDSTGAQPRPSDKVKVHYRGMFADGQEFDSSYQRNQPMEFSLQSVIKCWTEGVILMKVGEKARLVCPPQLAYGERGAGGVIPPNATLTYEIELLDIMTKYSSPSVAAASVLTEKRMHPAVIVSTTMGTFKIELYDDKAPLTVQNFLAYVDSKFYDGTIFHRVISNFMVQGGGMTPNMQAKPTRSAIGLESRNGLSNIRGSMAMARTSVPDSATAQFFINVKDNAFLDQPNSRDGHGYAVFGKVVEGMDVVDKIQMLPTGNRGLHQSVPLQPVIIESIRDAGLIAPAPAIANDELAQKNKCLICHAIEKKVVGPSFKDVAKKYAGQKDAETKLIEKVKKGSIGVWGQIPMPPNSAVKDEDIVTLVEWILAGASRQHT